MRRNCPALYKWRWDGSETALREAKAPLRDAGPMLRSGSLDLSHARAVRAVLSAIRLGHHCYQAVTSEIAEYRNAVDRDRHRARKSKSPSSFAHAGAKDTVTRIAPAVITMANTPA